MLNIVNIITLVGISITAFFSFLNWSHSKRNTYINSINSERRQWVSNLRRNCVDQLTTSFQLFIAIKHKNLEVEIENTSMWAKIYELENEAYLLLNPTENVVQYLIEMYNDLKEIFHSNIFRAKCARDKRDKIVLIQQIILKSEWKIIKTETESGKELDKVEKNNILLIIAHGIDKNIYNELLERQK